MSRHAFYVPVVLAAARFGLLGTIITGVLAAILAGPLVPGGAPPEIWLTRGAFLLGVGAIVAALSAATERTAAHEVELAERETRLQEQRTALIQTVSHEFRTPLTVIRGVAEIFVNQQERLPDALRPLAGALRRAERRLSDMLGVVLAAADAMGGALQQEAVDVRALVNEAAATLDRSAAERIRIDVPSQSETIVTSRSHARLLLRCLLDNALRFSDPDEPVDVTVHVRDGSTVLCVRDRGEGMDPEFIMKAFEPFTQADGSTLRRHGGLGMGLFTARQLARRLGGDVEIHPAPHGRGSVATVSLPQRRDTDLRNEPRPARPLIGKARTGTQE